MTSNKKNRYLIHCDFCGKRVIVHHVDELSPFLKVPQASIPRGYLHLETEEVKKKFKESKVPEFFKVLPRNPMVKCSCCGRGLVLKRDATKLPDIVEGPKVEKEDNGT